MSGHAVYRDLPEAFASEPIGLPPGFVLGAATAAYQIEGATREDGRGTSIWDTFCHIPGTVRNGDTGDLAANHYHRLDTDVDIIAELGLHAYRFSVAWPRVQPDGRGPANARGLDFYRRLVDRLRARGVEPVVTLYHWDLPQPLQDAGGWASRDTAARFAAYAELVAQALGGGVSTWITLNEPWCSAFLGYAAGTHAPGRRVPAEAAAAAHHLLLGHGEALAALRAAVPTGRHGITLNLAPAIAATDAPEDAAAAAVIDGFQNRLFLDPVLRGRYPHDVLERLATIADLGFVRVGDLDVIGRPIDFLGVNYYQPHVVRRRDAPVVRPDSEWPAAGDAEVLPGAGETTAMGWRVQPSALEGLLLRIHREYRVPTFVTENGAAFDDYVDPEGHVHDPDRIRFLDGHLRAVAAAAARGADVRGYFVWTLLDNFEWAQGYSKRFGIVHVDFASQARMVKDSGRWYAGVIRSQNGAGPGG